MIKTLPIAAICAVIPLMSLADGANLKRPDCYCTDTAGSRVELGETVCLTVDGRSYQAQCEMMLNNPMWREVGSGCTVSRREAPDPVATAPVAVNG